MWVSRAILVAYGILVLSSYWSQLSDIDTTLRLVESDVGCSLTAIDCNWLNFAIDKIVGMAVIGFAFVAQLWSSWRHRDRVQIGAAIVAMVHLIALQALLNPS